MNDILNELLANASAQNQQRNVTQPQTLGALKQAKVAATSANKVAALGGPVPTAQEMYAPLVGAQTGAGATSAAPVETDIRNMDTSELERKYGYGAAAQIIANRATANNSIFADQTQQRDWSQTAADLVSGVGLGAANSIGGIGAMGLGVVNADAGQAAATKLEDFGSFVRDTQSPALQQRRKVLVATDLMDKRDNDLQYEKDKAAGKGITADLARFGRGVVDGIANAIADPITLSDGVAEGSGSFLALAPVSRAANAAKLLKAAAAKDTALAAGKTIEEATAIAKSVMAKDGMAIPAAIGAMEAGGSYQGSVAEISNMTHEQLLAGSPAYAEMIAAGISPEKARTSVANKAGLMAAAITAPFAVAAGSLVKGFEGNPLKMGAGKVAAMNMGKETIEEGSQGITGAIASNLGIQTFANKDKSLSENVGEQGGRGALYGLGTAGVMAAPSVLAGSSKSAAGSVVGGVTNYLTDRADAVTAANEAASPASINRTVEKSAALVEVAPALKVELEQALAPVAKDSPEVAAAKATALADFPGFIDALNIQPTELQSPLLQPVANVIAATKTRPEAITAVLADMKQEKDPRAYFEKAVALQALIDTALAATDKLGGIDDTLLPPDVSKLFQSVASIGDSLMQSPEVMGHLDKASKLLKTPAGVKLMNEMQQTPESAQTIVAAAQIDPTAVNPAVAGVVLKMAQSGKLVLTEAQTKSLEAAKGLMESAQTFDDELKAQGVPKLRDIVTFEIKTEDDPKLDRQGSRSALQHARGIAGLAIRGDMAGAKAALEAFGNFALGQSNKVTGINQHYAAGPNAPRVTVQVASYKGGMTDIKTPVGITPTSPGSLNHAKRVTAEARFLTNMHNLLNETYNLGVAPLPIIELDAALAEGRTADVAAEFTNGKRGYPQQQKLTPTPAVVPAVTTVVTPAVKAKKERKPKAIKEPKPLKISKAVKASKTEKLQARLTTEKRPNILAQINAELELRKNLPTTETPSVTQTPETIQTKPNQATQEASAPAATETPAVTPVITPAKVDTVVTPAAPVITPTIVPNAPSLMGQAIAAASMVTPPAAPKTVAEAYPELLGNSRGVTSLDKAFSLRKTASRFLGSVSPAALVQSVLSSTESLVDFLGKDTTKRSLSPEIATYYAERVPAMVGELVKRMNASMNAAIDIVPKSGTSLRMLLDKGEPVHDYLRGKALNIVESDGKGGYVYNQELVEAAVLGSLNWFQNATNTGVIREESDIAALLGINEEDVSPAMLAAFNSGGQLTMWDVIPRMAANITEFWGMKANADFSQSATVGIPQAVATEVLTAMIEVGLVEYNKIRPEGATQDLNVFTLDHEQLGTGYEAYPTFLAEMANSEIVEPMYFGDATVPVAKTQMNNADVALTDDQKKAIEHEQKTPFYLNQPMLELYKQLGLDSLLEIFGAGVLNEDDKKLFNKTHLETVEGKNLSILSAYESLLGRAEEMQNIADASGVPLNKLAARFAYGMSRVGRMQMLGKQNPQASKLVREALMPNAATIDLTNIEDYNGYMLAVAQMLGIKVHTKPIEDSVSEAVALLNGKLKPAVDLMLKFNETGTLDKDAEEVLKELMPAAGSTFMGLHAIVDYARTQADGFDATNYTTNVYVEADGVTNGPVNAMVNLAAGKFTLSWLRNIAKGGLFLTPDQTMNQHRKTDGVDLYMQSTTHFANARNALKANLDKNNVGQQMTTLMKLMGTFVKDITVNEQTGEVTLQRGVAKNPLTITIYGSGERGIANKVVGELLDSIYAKMSEAMQKQAAYNAEKDASGTEMTFAQAMFGLTHPNPEAAFSEFRNALAQLSTRIIVYSFKKDKYYNVPHSIDPFDAPSKRLTTAIRVGDPQLFKVTGAQLAALQENMLTLFVKPLRQGIEQTVGSKVMATAKMLQVATQVQSIGLQAAFKQAVAAALKKFARPDTLFLSKNEQTMIMQELIKQFPTVKTKAQEFLIASTSQSQVKASDFSRALNNGLEMKASVFAPADSGVAGSPFLNIGMGDGLMMQTMSLMKDAIQGTLKIFDGVNIPVDKIKEGSLQANTAVAETWQGNPMRAVADSFKAARINIVDAMKGATEDEIKAVERIFVSLELPSLDMKDGIDYILSEVEHMANQVEARHLTMQAVAHSIDQMASAEAPFQNQGEDLSGLSPEAQVIRLNEIYKAKLLEVQARYTANASVSAELQGRNSEMIPRIMYTFEGMLTEIRKLPADLQETAKQALRSPAMRDYLIIVASPDDINAETGGLLGSSNGVTDVENKRIYIASTNPEVWVHELVHAATFEKVQSVLNGTNKDKMTIAAVERLQALRDQFNVMSSDQANWTTEQVRAYREAMNSMADALQQYGEAAELNEFMAWTTTNSALIEVGKQTKATFRAFEKITRAVVNTIRRIFFGSSPDKLPRDFFNAVRFNTTLIATRKQPSATEEGQNLILRHTNSYGNDARLNQIQSTYLSMMAPLFAGLKNQAKKVNAAIYSTNLTLAVEAAFPMNQQEKSTFQTVVTALATEAAINPTSLAKAQELYNHVTKQLEVEDFMNNPELQDPVDRFYAQEKYDVIMGKTGLAKDNLGRSSLMPVFLALATTDDGFRSILAKMNMPEVAKNIGTTLDVYLRNYGTTAMEAMSDKLSGVKYTDSITQAIDNLQSNIIANNVEKTSVLGMVSNKFGGWVDTANDYAVDKLTSTATAGVKLGDKMKSSKIKAVSTAGSIVKVLSGSMSDKTSAFMAEGLLSAMNKQNGLQPLRDFANDMLGRVASNANIYDMIKQVRSTVASVRQEFRENVPMKLAKTFKTELSDDTWTELNRAMGKTDIAALDMPFTDIVELVRNKAQTAREIKSREDAIRAEVGTAAGTYLLKSKQLAKYMKTGIVGNNLLRNAHAIAYLIQHKPATPALIKNIDELVSLYAVRDMEQNERDAFNSLAQDEGLEFTFVYLKQQRADETEKALQHKGSKLNHYKGYIPSVQSSGMSLIVADDTQDARLKAMSYVRVGDYNGAGAEGTVSKRGYYFNNAPTRGTFNQGIMQNVNITANGVSAVHGFTQGLTAGVITDPIYVAKLFKRINAGAEKGTNEHLMPIFDELGSVTAYERSVDPVQLERLQSNNKLHQMLGVWRGRQIEEAMANEINNKLVDNMVALYEKDKKANRGSEYVNIFDPKDKILVDALKLMPADVRDYMKSRVVDPDEFWVRRDMVFDAFGYRTASVGDAWTGNSRFSDETQKVFQKVAIGVMGNQAFSRLLATEKFIQGFMADARTTIVVKSVIVPALNLISNLGQLVARGVPLKDILRKSPAKTAEIESYVKNRIRQVDAEAELRAAKGTNEKLKLEAEIQSLKDAQRRLTIWPLIEAGEFTAISDVGITHDDIDLSQGRWHQYIEKKVDKLPEAVRNAGRYAYITKDTALFQGLQKAVQYGDFLAKAIMYDDMVLRQKKTPVEAMARITEEFVNYDRLPGRFRGYLEQMGMLWFYNFKLRSSKVAISMMRNNPIHALMSNFMPVPDVFGPVGSPLEDNFLAKAVSDTLGYSIGPGMGFRAPTMNPWWQMVN